ncbi:hypothetical protein PFICI_05175 [Pestalotiopsis fici W106-1]|uniref:HTH APSES-type domain-containing protein n=1 Tax=Pestalotiopsis fici (strain W106-1 / CGMCC3.15140) TaxID=1229662 RepID=W3XBA6_PESFW|nr:uncharacterized protein PFICI_05175 [Pestalotiopsis fici W106-1]ETS83299.1 hypothetical protein PFICI_05175 [Pestalotiopsis fici W106-1]
MLSVASLLNPAPPVRPSAHRLPPSPVSSASPPASLSDESALCDRSVMPKNKMPKDAAVFTKAKPKGVINFRPFEQLEESSMREIRKYRVFPLGNIQEYCRHIPYNSGKKDFYEKTGRESFEVFQYVFKLPRDNTEYAVMWDYNVGLVRMTPFFKCCKYSKTTPAKMLNLNPGLKEISHSITGGSIMAQGYWMPYHCAKAVCATFCHHIAGALIPIFGPDFPMRCIPPEAPEHGRMIIDPAIISESTREAAHFRQMYSNMMAPTNSPSPKRDRKVFKSVYDDGRHHPRLRLRRPFLSYESPYGTDTEGEHSPVTDRNIPERFNYASIPPIASHRVTSGWSPVNIPSHRQEAPAPSPWLSAVPRITGTPSYSPSHAQHTRVYSDHPQHTHLRIHPHHHHHHHHPHHHHHHHASPSQHTQVHERADGQDHQHWRHAKRSAEHIDPEHGYDGDESRNTTAPSTAATSPLEDRPSETSLGSDKNAAMLLMNLSVRDTGSKRSGRCEGAGTASETTTPVDVSFPRVKRSRASSM